MAFQFRASQRPRWSLSRLNEARRRPGPLMCVSMRRRNGLFQFGFFAHAAPDRRVLCRITEKQSTIENAPLHPRVAGEIFHPLTDAVIFVRTTPTSHTSPSIAPTLFPTDTPGQLSAGMNARVTT